MNIGLLIKRNKIQEELKKKLEKILVFEDRNMISGYL